MSRTWLGVIGLAMMLTWIGPAAAQPKGVQALRNLPYVANGHQQQRLDIFLPEKPAGRLPLIVWIHGGGWAWGSKEDCLCVPLVAKGYAVAAINYRFSQHALFPAQIEDCKAAIRWLRANADKYHFDPDHIGVWGSSAGGHLVALLGTTGGRKEFEGKDGNLDQSSRVQCVVDWCGPAEMLTMGKLADKPDTVVAKLIGGPVQNNKEKARRGQPPDLRQQGFRALPHHARRQGQHRAAGAEREAGRGAEEGGRGGATLRDQGQRARRPGVHQSRELEAHRGLLCQAPGQEDTVAGLLRS